MKQPTPKQIKAARHKAGLTQVEAGLVVNAALRTWAAWEGGERKMPPIVLWAFHKRLDESELQDCFQWSMEVLLQFEKQGLLKYDETVPVKDRMLTRAKRLLKRL